MKKKILTLSLVLVMVACALIIFSGCGVELTDPQNVKYNGTTITWDSVENATGYTISINGGTEWPVSNTSYPYNAKGQEFSVSITAVSDAKKLVESGTTTMTFKPLDKVENVKFDQDGVFSWDPVNFASGYKMRLDGVEVNEVIPGTTYSNLPAGNHTVQFKPIVEADPSYFAVWSDAVSVNVLGKVENIQYSNGTLSWGYVSGAQKYQVCVNGIIVEESIAATSMFYDSENRNFEVTVKALGNGTTVCNGTVSDVKSFIYLDTITDVRVEDGIAIWSEVNGADGYKIKINGSVVNETLSEAKYDRLYANQSIDIQVMPVSNDTTYFSDWSSVKSVFILAAPTLQWNDYELNGDANANIYWDNIANAAGYSVKITYPDGRVETKSSTEVSFREAYLEAGTYSVQVKATADSVASNYYDSQYSIPLTVTRLKAPTAVDRNFITSNPDKLSEGFTVTFTNVNGASEYVLYQDEHPVQRTINSQFTVAGLIDSNVMEQQTLNFSIQSVGSVKPSSAGGIHAILSSLTEESLYFEIKILSTPTNIDISGYNLSYTGVDQGYGYSVSVAGNSYTSNATSYDLSLLEAGNYQVMVCSRGNGTNVLASNYTPAINVHRLEAPTNVKIETADSAEGLISFDDVMYAQGYYIVYNNDGNALPVSKMENVKQYITEAGTTVYLTASANYFNDDRTVYYMSSQPSATYNFIKLAAPTFGNAPFSSGQLAWNAPGNVSANVYTPTYEVYNIDGDAYTGEKNGTAMDLSFLEGGKSYTFSVKAIGDGTRYINSDVSTKQVTIYKLQTPEIRRENGQYVWNSVVDAVSYAMYIDGKLVDAVFHQSGSTYSYTPYFTELKDHTVELIATGDGLTSVDSSKCVVIQKIAQLQKPDYSVSYSQDQVSDDGKIVLTITEESPYAKGYSYTIGGTTHTSTEKTYSLNPSSVGTISTIVYACGGNFDEDGVYYIDSQPCGNSAKYSITLLASPDVSSFKITTDGKMTWTNIASAIKYELQISVNGGEYETVIVNDPMYIIENYSNVSSVSVIIKAVGDGNRIITSKEVEYSKTK